MSATLKMRSLRLKPKWLDGIMGPTLALCLYAVAWGIVAAISGGHVPKRAEVAASVALSLILASWVVADARKRKRKLPYDFDSFVYFAWPVIVPIYIFQSRGVRGFLTLLGFSGIGLLYVLAAFAVTLLQDSEL
jgi:hypothetical protein